MKGSFGTLKELAESGLIGSNYALDNPIAGYVYSSVDTTPESYCVRAIGVDEKRDKRDFNITGEGLVRYHETKESNTAACGKGLSLTTGTE